MAALGQLMSMVDWDVWPELDAAELEQCLTDARRDDEAGNPPDNVAAAAGWVTAHVYTAGTVIENTASRFWLCVVAGTSGTTEPVWRDLDGYRRSDWQIADNQVVWRDNGGPWAETYDLGYAANRAWLLKAGKAASATDFKTDGQAFDRAAVHAHCLTQADRWARHQRTLVA